MTVPASRPGLVALLAAAMLATLLAVVPAAVPAAAQTDGEVVDVETTIWSSTLTVGTNPGDSAEKGYQAANFDIDFDNFTPVFGALSDVDQGAGFEYGGKEYGVTKLSSLNNSITFELAYNREAAGHGGRLDREGSYKLYVGGGSWAFGEAQFRSGTDLAADEVSHYAWAGTLPESGDHPVRLVELSTTNRPVFNDGTSTTRSIPENSSPGTAVGAPVTATDADGGTLAYSFRCAEGADCSDLAVNGATGQLSVANVRGPGSEVTEIDFEDIQSYSLTMHVSDGQGASASIAVTVNVVDVAEPPTVSGSLEAAVADGTTDSIRVAWATANTGPAVTHYQVQYKLDGVITTLDRQPITNASTTALTGGAAGHAATVGGLIAGTHQVQVRLTNDEGTGAWSDAVSVGLGLCAGLCQVEDLTVTPSATANALDVSWSRVPDARNYTVQWKSGADADYSSAREQTSELRATSLTIASLSAGTEYTVRVRAAADAAVGPWSDEATGTPVGGICGRTPVIQRVLIYLVIASNCADVTSSDLAGIDLGDLNGGLFNELHDNTGVRLTLPPLKAGDFAGLSGVIEDANPALGDEYGLNLSNYGITSVVAGAFTGLSGLKQLDLTGNAITDLPAGAFTGLDSVTSIRLQNNQLADVEAGAFSNLPMLDDLRISNNKLSALPDGIFQGVPALTTLRIQKNPKPDSTDALPLAVRLEADGTGRFKAVAPAGAPFELVLPVQVENGSITGGATTLTIPPGATESAGVAVTRTPGTEAAVTATLGAAPPIPPVPSANKTVGHRGYVIAPSAAPFTVIPGPDVPVVSVTAGTSPVTEGTAAQFTVTADRTLTSALTVNLEVMVTDDGNPAQTVPSQTVTIAANTSSTTYSHTIPDDSLDEPDGSVQVTVATGEGYAPGAQPGNTATVTVSDNEAAPTLTVGNSTVDENAGTASVTVTASGLTTSQYRCWADLTDQRTTADTADFSGLATTFAAAAGARFGFTTALTHTVSLTVVDDSLDEDSEKLVVRCKLDDDTGDTVTGVVTITDDDDEVAVSVAADSDTVVEGAAAAFTVSIGSALASDLTVDLDVTVTDDKNPAATGRVTVTINAGETSAPYSRSTTDDDLDEPAGSVQVAVVQGAGYTVGSSGSATVTVNDNDGTGNGAGEDGAGLSLTATGSVNEGDAGDTAVVVRVSNTVKSTAEYSCTTASSSDDVRQTATAGSDFQVYEHDSPSFRTATGTQNLPSFKIIGDHIDEGDVKAVIVCTRKGFDADVVEKVITISDDDTRGIAIAGSPVEVTEGSTGTYTVKLNSQPTADVTLTLAANNAAVSVGPSPLTFTTTDWSTAQTVTVTGEQDDNQDAETGVRITHTAAGGDYGANSVSAAAAVILTDDDAPTGPAVESIAFVGSPLSGDTYSFREWIVVRVTFDAPVLVHQDLALTLRVGTLNSPLTFSGPAQGVDPSPVEHVDFEYQVFAGDTDTDGLSVAANSLRAKSSSTGPVVTAAAGPLEATLSHPAIAADPNRKVDGNLIRSPEVLSVSLTSSPASAPTYERGEVITAAVTFNRKVDVYGSPQLALQVGSVTRQMGFESGFDSEVLTFAYTVRPGDLDTDGVSIPADGLSLNEATIVLRGTFDDLRNAVLDHDAAAADAGHQVNGGPAVAPPTIESVAFVGGPADGETYAGDEQITAQVTFDSQVTMTGDPRLRLEVGGTTVLMGSVEDVTPEDMTAKTVLEFSYVVRADVSDADGVRIPADALVLSGQANDDDVEVDTGGEAFDGSIMATADDTVAAVLTHAQVQGGANRKVDGSRAKPPQVQRVSLDSGNTPATGDTFTAGEVIQVHVIFDDVVTVTGSPQLALTVGSAVRQMAFAGVLRGDEYGGSSERIVRFEYTVRHDDADDDGISVAANSLSLNGGTIRHRDDAAVDAVLTHDLVPAFIVHSNPRLSRDPHKVDGTRSVVPRLTVTTATANSLTVTWTAPTEDTTTITGYDVRYRRVGTAAWTDGPQSLNALTTTLTGLDPDTSYEVQARAVRGSTAANWSFAVSGATLADRGIAITGSPVAVNEGDTATYTVALAGQPTGDVTVTLASDNAAVSVSPSSLTFTTVNWSTAQAVTVTGVQDDNAADETGITVTHTANGGGYVNVTATATVNVTDNDHTETVDGTAAHVIELPQGASVTVQMLATNHVSRTPPAGRTFVTNPVDVNVTGLSGGATVTVCLAGEGVLARHDGTQWTLLDTTHRTLGGTTASCAEVTNTSPFAVLGAAATPGYELIWETTMTVAANFDGQRRGWAHNYGQIGRSDFTYRGKSYQVRQLHRISLGLARLVFGMDSSLPPGSFRLTIGDVSSDFDGTESLPGQFGSERHPYYRFVEGFEGQGGAAGWNIGQQLAVRLEAPGDADGPVITIEPGEAVTEGSPASFTVRADTAPTSDLEVSLRVGVFDDGATTTVSPDPTVTILANTTSAQFTRTVPDDDLDEPNGSVTATVVAGAGYWVTDESAKVTATVAVNDDDGSLGGQGGAGEDGATLTITGGSVAEGASGEMPMLGFTITADVRTTKAYSCRVAHDDTRATPMRSGVDYTFVQVLSQPLFRDSTTYTFEVSVIGNDVDQGDRTVAVDCRRGEGGHPIFTGSLGTITDDDTAGLVLTPATVEVTEGSTADYTVALASNPVDDVTVAVASNDTAVATVSPAELTFTAENWNAPQPVTVTGVADADVQTESTTITHTVTGGAGGRYDTVAPVSAQVDVTDADIASLAAPTVDLKTRRSVLLTWTGVEAATGYDVRYRRQGAANWTERLDNGPEPVAIVAGLTPDQAYEFGARLRHDFGGGGVSSWSPSVTATPASTDTPGAVIWAATVTVAGTSERPAVGARDLTDSTIEHFGGTATISGMGIVTLRDHENILFQLLRIRSGGGERVAGTAYRVLVVGSGGSYWSNWQSFPGDVIHSEFGAANNFRRGRRLPMRVVEQKLPLAPEVTLAAVSTDQVRVDWTAPDNTGRPDITGYQLRYRVQGAGEPDWTAPVAVSGFTHTLSGLTAGTGYEVQVRAVNIDGAGEWRQAALTEPTIRIAAAADTVQEGQTARFTLTADAAWTADVDVSLNLVTQGDYGITAGARTIRLPAPSTHVVLELPIADDNVDEHDGSVEVTVTPGTGYAVAAAPNNAAATAITDNDDPARLIIWEATLTGGDETVTQIRHTGYNAIGPEPTIGSLSDATFVFKGTTYTVTKLLSRFRRVNFFVDRDDTRFELDRALPAHHGAFHLRMTQPGATDRTCTIWGGASFADCGAYGSSPGNWTVTLTQAQQAPSFNEGDTATRSFDEHIGSATDALDVGDPVAAFDVNDQTLTYSLSGADASSFTINGATGQISTKAGVNFDYETDTGSYSLTVTVNDGTGALNDRDSIDVTVTLDDASEPPAAPAAPTAATIAGQPNQLSVRWTAPGNTGRPGITGYDLRYRAQGSGESGWTFGPSVPRGLTGTLTGLTAGTAYDVQVRAYNDDGDGEWSPSGIGAVGSPAPFGAIPTVWVANGTQQTVELGPYFDGASLTFTASSADSALAAVTVNGSQAVVTGGASGHGDVVVTVTATNSLGSAQSTFVARVGDVTPDPFELRDIHGAEPNDSLSAQAPTSDGGFSELVYPTGFNVAVPIKVAVTPDTAAQSVDWHVVVGEGDTFTRRGPGEHVIAPGRNFRVFADAPSALGASLTVTVTIGVGDSAVSEDWVVTTRPVAEPTPVVQFVDFVGAPGFGAAYVSGEPIEVEVTFDRAVVVAATPQLELTVGATARQMDFEQVVAPTGTVDATSVGGGSAAPTGTKLRFSYVVDPGDADSDGVSIPQNALTLNGGQIRSAGNLALAASLAHGAVGARAGRAVDGSLSPVQVSAWSATLYPVAKPGGFENDYGFHLYRTSNGGNSDGGLDPWQFSHNDVDYTVRQLARTGNSGDANRLRLNVESLTPLTAADWQLLVGEPAVVLDLSDATAATVSTNRVRYQFEGVTLPVWVLDSADADYGVPIKLVPAKPVISVRAGAGSITEGEAASFVISSDRAPDVDLEVSVDIAADGFGVTGGPQTVTIPAGQTAAPALSVPTTADPSAASLSTAITATLTDVGRYRVQAGAESASVAVHDRLRVWSGEITAGHRRDGNQTLTGYSSPSLGGLSDPSQFQYGSDTITVTRISEELSDSGETFTLDLSGGGSSFNGRSFFLLVELPSGAAHRFDLVGGTTQPGGSYRWTSPPGLSFNLDNTYRVMFGENLPVVTVEAVDASVAEGQPVQFRVSIDKAPQSEVMAKLQVNGGSAYGIADGLRTVTFPAGDGTAQILSLPSLNNHVVQAHTSVSAALSDATTGALIGDPSSASVALNDNDRQMAAPTVDHQTRRSVLLTWPSRPGESGYDGRYRRQGDSTWTEAFSDRNDTAAIFGDLSLGAYEFQVRLRYSFGAAGSGVGDWSPSASATLTEADEAGAVIWFATLTPGEFGGEPSYGRTAHNDGRLTNPNISHFGGTTTVTRFSPTTGIVYLVDIWTSGGQRVEATKYRFYFDGIVSNWDQFPSRFQHSDSGARDRFQVGRSVPLRVVEERLPQVPTGLTLDAERANFVDLSWTAPDNAGRPAISGYEVRYRLDGSGDPGWFDGPSHSTVSGRLHGLTPGQTYDVQVRASNIDGPGAWSASVTATTNTEPTAEIADGHPDTVFSGETVQLRGTGSDTETADADLTYRWTQTAGPTVAIQNANSATAGFTAPDVNADTDLTFRLTVTDEAGDTAQAEVTIAVWRGISGAVWQSRMTVGHSGSGSGPVADGDYGYYRGVHGSLSHPEINWSGGPHYVAGLEYTRQTSSSGVLHLSLDLTLTREPDSDLCALGFSPAGLYLAIAGVDGVGSHSLDLGAAHPVQCVFPNEETIFELIDHGVRWTDGQQLLVALMQAPTVSIAHVADLVDEGRPARFRVSAHRPVVVDLAVALDIAVEGDFGVSAGPQTVTIPAGQSSVELSLPTTNDEADEPHGSVTATLAPGSGYGIASAPGNSARVAVHDDDGPPRYQLWSATLDARNRTIGTRSKTGYFAADGGPNGTLTPRQFTHRKPTSVIELASERLVSESDSSSTLEFALSESLGAGSFVLQIGNKRYSFQGTGGTSHSFSNEFISVGDGISVTLHQLQEPPSFTDGGSTTRSFDENIATQTNAGVSVGDPIAATDANPGQTLTYHLSGTDADKFSLDSGTGQLSTLPSRLYDYEAGQTRYSLTLTVDDGTGASNARDTIAVTITLDDVSEPPLKPAAPSVVPAAGDAAVDTLDVTATLPDNTGRPAFLDPSPFQVRYRVVGAASFTESSVQRAANSSLTGLQPGTTYEVQVRAHNAEGAGPWSDSAMATTAGSSTVGGVSVYVFNLPTGSAAMVSTLADDHDSRTPPSGKRFVSGPVDVNVNPALSGTQQVQVCLSGTGDLARYDGTAWQTLTTTARTISTVDHACATVTQTSPFAVLGDATLTAPVVETDSWLAGSVVLRWSEVEGATGYRVQWKSEGQSYGDGSRQADVTDPNHEVDLPSGGAVTLRVAALGGSVLGPWSAEVLPPVSTVSLAAHSTMSDEGSSNRVSNVLRYVVTFDPAITEPVTLFYSFVPDGTTATYQHDFLYYRTSRPLNGGVVLEALRPDLPDLAEGGLGKVQVSKWEITQSQITNADGGAITTRNLGVTIVGDRTPEPDETIVLKLWGARGARLGTSLTATNTIVDDDEPPVIEVGNYASNYRCAVDGLGVETCTPHETLPPLGAWVELDGETRTVSFPVQVKGGFSSPVSVSYTFQISGTAVGTATLDADYTITNTSGTVTFSGPQDTREFVEVTLLADDAVEDDETIVVCFSNVQGATLSRADNMGILCRTLVIEDRPSASGTMDDIEVGVGLSQTIDAAAGFAGNVKTYSATSADDTIAKVQVDGADVTVIGVAEGATTITVTATNTEVSATQTFMVTVVATPDGIVWKARLTVGQHPTPSFTGAGYVHPNRYGSVSGRSFIDGGRTFNLGWLAYNTNDQALLYRATTADAGTFSSATLCVPGLELTLPVSSETDYRETFANLAGQAPWNIGDVVTVGIVRSPATCASLTSSPNTAPSFDDGDSATRSIAENTGAATDATARSVGNPLTATDPDTGDTLTYSLTGTDAASFAIVSTTGQIQTRTDVNYDREAKAQYNVTVEVSDGNGGTDTIAVTISLTNVSEPPLAPATPSVAPAGGDASVNTISITATVPDNTGRPPLRDPNPFQVRYRISGSSTFTESDQERPATTTLTSLLSGTTYEVQVRAHNADGAGPWSDSATATTAYAQTVDGVSVYVFDLPTGSSASASVLAGDHVSRTPPAGKVFVSGPVDVSVSPALTVGQQVQVCLSGAGDLARHDDSAWQALTTTARTIDTVAHACADTSQTSPFAVLAGTGVDAPVATGSVFSQLTFVGETVMVDVSGSFAGVVDSYTASSSDTGVATVSVSDSVVSVTGAGVGTATITVTATNGGGNATQTFGVEVLSSVAPPRVTGVISAVSVAVGASSNVDVASFFTGTVDSYSASSSNDAVASVSVSVSTVTVRGVAEGPAVVEVTASNEGGSATQGFAVTVTAGAPTQAPGQVSAPSVAATANTQGSLTVVWSAPSGAAVASYDVQYRRVGSVPWVDGPQDVAATTAVVADLEAGTQYDVRVQASNAVGDGEWSLPGRGATLPPPAPSVTSVAFTSAPVSGDTYGAGETIEVTVTFSRPVEAAQRPSVTLSVGRGTREASYLRRSDDRLELVFGYEVAAGDVDTDGVAIAANALGPAGSVIVPGGEVDAVLSHGAVAADATRKVAGTVIEAVGVLGDVSIELGSASYEVDAVGAFSGDSETYDYTVSSSDPAVARATVKRRTYTIDDDPLTPHVDETREAVQQIVMVTAAAVGATTVTVTAASSSYGDVRATQTFVVTVTALAPPRSLHTDAVPAHAWVGADNSEDLSRLFAGTVDSYSAALQNPADASMVRVKDVSGGSVLLRGVVVTPTDDPVEVVVTATNPAGSATVTLAVRVHPLAGAIPAVRLAPRQTHTTERLDRYFTGGNLEYEVSSSNNGVATATIQYARRRPPDYERLAPRVVITAVAAGSAVVTVTASNGDGRVTQTIAVTVTEATAGVSIDPDTDGRTSSITEGGETEYTVVLNTQPTGTVTVTPSSSDTDALTVSPSSLTFTAADWNTPQSVTATAVDDGEIYHTPRVVTVSHAVLGYGSVTTGPSFTLSVRDPDALPVITISPVASSVTEGTDAEFRVTSSRALSSGLTVFVDIAAEGEFGVDPSQSPPHYAVLFPAYQSSATFSVSTTSDDVEEAHGSVTVTLATREDYTVGNPSSATVEIRDDDGANASLNSPPVITAVYTSRGYLSYTDRLPEGGTVVSGTRIFAGYRASDRDDPHWDRDRDGKHDQDGRPVVEGAGIKSRCIKWSGGLRPLDPTGHGNPGTCWRPWQRWLVAPNVTQAEVDAGEHCMEFTAMAEDYEGAEGEKTTTLCVEPRDPTVEVRGWNRNDLSHELSPNYQVTEGHTAFMSGSKRNGRPSGVEVGSPYYSNGDPGGSYGGFFYTFSGRVWDYTTPVTFLWEQLAFRDSPAVTLEGAQGSYATFVAPQVGRDTTLKFRLTVTEDRDEDGVADENGGTASQVFYYTVRDCQRRPTWVCRPPQVDAGGDVSVMPGEPVGLHGTVEPHPDASPGQVRRRWEQIEGPWVALRGADSDRPGFDVPPDAAPGTAYAFMLTATDSDGESDIDVVEVTVEGSVPRPVACAGPDVVGAPGEAVTLQGRCSTNPHGPWHRMDHVWTQLSGPAVALDDIRRGDPTFTIPADTADGTVLEFELRVTDQQQYSDTDTVAVTVDSTPPPTPPTACAGPDLEAQPGDTVTLQGACSTNPHGQWWHMAHQWTQPPGQNIALSDTTRARPTLTVPSDAAAGTVYTFTLTVTDHEGETDSDTMTVTVPA